MRHVARLDYGVRDSPIRDVCQLKLIDSIRSANVSPIAISPAAVASSFANAVSPTNITAPTRAAST